MNREEIIQSLRACGNGVGCYNCAVKCENGCRDNLMRIAADMLEADGKPEKTADEMFRELGYSKTLRSVTEPDPREISYANNIFEIGATPYEVYKFNHVLREITAFSNIELPAVCKLLGEMEATP